MDLYEFITENENTIRPGFFAGTLTVMALWEIVAPRRALSISKVLDWSNNLGLFFFNSFIERLLFPATTVGVAAFEGAMIAISKLKQRLETGEDLLLPDVRTAEDYIGEQGHIAGSTLVPLEELEQRLDEPGDYLERPVITICRTDRKSAKAAQLLAQKGFADVHVAKMGITDWIKNEYPVET